MASTGVSYSNSEVFRGGEKQETSGAEKPAYSNDVESSAVSIKTAHDSTHRKLKPRHIQLIGIGGTIGTALYVQIGRGLMNGGPASLFLAFTIWYVTGS
jgi:amino acid transporter